MNGLDRVKQHMSLALQRLDLEGAVSLEEIEKEIAGVDTAFQSLLMLGILRRIMHRQDNKAAELFVPAVTEWKNYLPHKELGGLTPEEMMKKYPPGPHESTFISEMMQEYQTRLEAQSDSSDDSFDVQADFARFQDEYLNRVPSPQLFASAEGRLMTIKEIIREERRRAGRPEENIELMGAKIFAENTADGTGTKMAAIDDAYISALEEMETMRRQRARPTRKNQDRVRAIRKEFERQEPYHRCGPAPHQFYSNYAAVVLLDDDNAVDLVISLLDRSLACKPDYDYARTMKRNIQQYYG